MREERTQCQSGVTGHYFHHIGRHNTETVYRENCPVSPLKSGVHRSYGDSGTHFLPLLHYDHPRVSCSQNRTSWLCLALGQPSRVGSKVGSRVGSSSREMVISSVGSCIKGLRFIFDLLPFNVSYHFIILQAEIYE